MTNDIEFMLIPTAKTAKELGTTTPLETKKKVVELLIQTFGAWNHTKDNDQTPFFLYDHWPYEKSNSITGWYGNDDRWIMLGRDQRFPSPDRPNDTAYPYLHRDCVALLEFQRVLGIDIYVGTEYFEPPQTNAEFEKFMNGYHRDDSNHEWMPLTLDMILEWDELMKYDNFDPEVLDTYMKDMERQLELNHSDDPEADKELDILTEEMDQLWAEMMKHATHEEVKRRVDLERNRRGLR